LLALDADKKDHFIIRRYEMDEPAITFLSKKIDGVEQTVLKPNDQEAYDNFFNIPNTNPSA
jgi:hypothetical protein